MSPLLRFLAIFMPRYSSQTIRGQASSWGGNGYLLLFSKRLMTSSGSLSLNDIHSSKVPGVFSVREVSCRHQKQKGFFGAKRCFEKSLGWCRPAAKYSPWFDVVLKSARLAVKTLTMLSEEVHPPPPPKHMHTRYSAASFECWQKSPQLISISAGK